MFKEIPGIRLNSELTFYARFAILNLKILQINGLVDIHLSCNIKLLTHSICVKQGRRGTDDLTWSLDLCLTSRVIREPIAKPAQLRPFFVLTRIQRWMGIMKNFRLGESAL